MKMSRIKSMPWRVIVQLSAVLILLQILAVPCRAADEASATEKASKAVSESAQSVNAGMTTIKERAAESHLTNRTSDDIVAFVLMGILVASVSGVFSKMSCSGWGMVGRIGLGLMGAYIGSMVVGIAQIDLGWSEVIMSYEELLFSLLGAISVVALSRFIQYKMKKKKAKS